jgi:hypothetical protein
VSAEALSLNPLYCQKEKKALEYCKIHSTHSLSYSVPQEMQSFGFFGGGVGWGIEARSLSLFFSILGLELRAYTLSYSTSPFCVNIFETGSPKLFAQAGFKP